MAHRHHSICSPEGSPLPQPQNAPSTLKVFTVQVQESAFCTTYLAVSVSALEIDYNSMSLKATSLSVDFMSIKRPQSAGSLMEPPIFSSSR